MTKTTPELTSPSPNFHPTPTGGRLATTYDLTCNRPNTRRIFSEIRFRTWKPPIPKPRPCHYAIVTLEKFMLITRRWRIRASRVHRRCAELVHVKSEEIQTFLLWLDD
ncbi:hypothetical protein AVEN_63460-1 [Araneus ventricosus]|uniref:Uncharacterized protein n=1 Tax=Araneus ventricosus TaxID=182803 RepID=A0A4Y2CT23_ARAVE|nr:hypothetical protein AVEN_63460-1 [Araneus ventricosus]